MSDNKFNPSFKYNLVPEPQVVSEDISDGTATGFMHKLRRSAEVTMLGIELSPLNEAIRFGAMGSAIASGANSLTVGAIAGVTTLAIEGGSAVAAAGLLTSDTGNKAVGWVNNKLENNLKISPEAKFSKLAKAGIAFLGGSAIVASVKYREEPDMTEKQTRNYGLKNAIALFGSVAIMGVGISKGLELPGPEMIGAGLVATGGLVGVWKKITNRIRREQIAEGINVDEINKKDEEEI